MPDIVRIPSPTYPWAPNGTINIPVNFMESARKMRRPVASRLVLRAQLTMNTGVAGGKAFALPQQFSRVQFQDGAGDRFNVSGASWRVILQHEYGNGFTDGQNVGVSQTGVSVERYYRIPYDIVKSRSRNDYRIPLVEILDGGTFNLFLNAASFGPATGWTITAGSYQLFAEIVEDRTTELKSRLCYFEWDVQNTEFSYPVSGALRSAVYYGGAVNENAQTPMAAQNFQSRTLDYANMPSSYLLDDYKAESLWARSNRDAASAVAIDEDVFVAGFAVPLFSPKKDQKTSQLPIMTALHWRTDGAVTTANLPKTIASIITPRAPNMTQRALGAGSIEEATQTTDKLGFIDGANGERKPVSRWNKQVAQFMPTKIGAPRKK